MTDSRVRASLIAPDDKRGEWEAEIHEAAEARQQWLEWLAKNPRPAPPLAMMQRSPGHHRYHTKTEPALPRPPLRSLPAAGVDSQLRNTHRGAAPRRHRHY